MDGGWGESAGVDLTISRLRHSRKSPICSVHFTQAETRGISVTSAFFSYSHKDRPVADYIAAHLRNRDVEIFIDYQKLQAGDFVSQLGHQIEKNKYFLVLISPASIASKWVQAEIGWAFSKKETCFIIPIWLESAPLTDVFVLGQLERVDFTRWHDDRKMDVAIQKLARLMQLPLEPTHSTTILEPTLSQGDAQDCLDVYSDDVPPPTFARGDVSSMFDAALAVEDADPEQALYLYEQVLENDPNFMEGSIKGFVNDKRSDLKPVRLQILTQRIETAKKKGNWREVTQLGRSMTDIDPANAYALHQIKGAEQGAQYESFYKRAIGASEDGNQEAVNNLMKYINQKCPDYGDPAGLLNSQPIRRELLGFLRNSQTLIGHNSPIIDIAFSTDENVIATASADYTVKLWSVSTGEQIAELNRHSGPVNSVAFSPDGKYLVSGSSDGSVTLWSVENLEILASAESGGKINDLAFSCDSNLLASAGKYGRLRVHQVPNIQSYDSANLGHGSFDLEITGIVFSGGTHLYSSMRKKRSTAFDTFFDYSIRRMESCCLRWLSCIACSGPHGWYSTQAIGFNKQQISCINRRRSHNNLATTPRLRILAVLLRRSKLKWLLPGW